MQLKARIKRIERRVKINHSPFCACEDFAGMIKPRVEVIYESDGIQTIENPIADFCERCRKPIDKQQIIIRFVESCEQLEN
jgi:hypothetical protein